MALAGSETEIEEAVMDKGYHDNRLLARLAKQGVRSYIPERRQKSRCWTDKPAAYEHAFRANGRRGRGRDIGEARIAPRDTLDPGAVAAARAADSSSPVPKPAMRMLPWLIAALLAGALVWSLALGGGAGRPVTGAARSPVVALRLPQGLSIPVDDRGLYGQTAVLAIAPDGSQVDFLEGAGNGPIYLRGIESDELRPLEGTAGSSSPFFSPDGRWVGFFSPGKLRKIAVDGGRPIDLADSTLDRGAVWCPDSSIVYAPNRTGGLFRLPPGGGAPVALQELPDGDRALEDPALLVGRRTGAGSRDDAHARTRDGRLHRRCAGSEGPLRP